MSMFRLYFTTLMLVGWCCASDDLNAQQRPPENRPPGKRGDGFDGPPGPPDGRRDGSPPRDNRGDHPPFGGGRGDGPPDGPPRKGGPREGGPPHDGPPRGRFGHENDLRRMEELKELDPEMYELEKSDREMERQTFELSEQYGRAPQDKRRALQEQMVKVVTEHFEVRQSLRELHLKRLSEELEKLRASIERRNDVRDQIIGKRVSELIGEEDDLAF